MRDDEYRALTEWLAEGPAGIGSETAEGELAADWQRSVSAVRWSRLCRHRGVATPGAASA
ncbi:hypothetical protein GCM10023201_59240 [Actinomycetospora corticicola]|uniref:Uncharacterized protein n=1 Tax=Actinomycetospora corticicola TaxID=663602 RepID=A0A7Y9J924_9PSEU|nr:hypothetical protein [Actinomycetospora corticicola]NYD39711.1 hypothetical protein [Actinomycetospora corticicola]